MEKKGEGDERGRGEYRTGEKYSVRDWTTIFPFLFLSFVYSCSKGSEVFPVTIVTWLLYHIVNYTAILPFFLPFSHSAMAGSST